MYFLPISTKMMLKSIWKHTGPYLRGALTYVHFLLSCSVLSGSVRPHGLWPTGLLCLWNFPGKNPGVGAVCYSKGSSWPRDWIWVSCVFCIGRQILYHWAAWEASLWDSLWDASIWRLLAVALSVGKKIWKKPKWNQQGHGWTNLGACGRCQRHEVLLSWNEWFYVLTCEDLKSNVE